VSVPVCNRINTAGVVDLSNAEMVNPLHHGFQNPMHTSPLREDSAAHSQGHQAPVSTDKTPNTVLNPMHASQPAPQSEDNVAHSEGHAAPTEGTSEKHSRRQLAKTRMHELDVEVEAMVGKVLEKAEKASNARQRRRRRAKRAPDMKGTHVPNPLRGGMQNPMFADSEDGEVASD
jgi:hypothetical protein